MESTTGALPGPRAMKPEIPRIEHELASIQAAPLEHQIQALAEYDMQLRRVLEDMQSNATS